MDPFSIAQLVGSGLGFIANQRNLKNQMAQQNQLMNQAMGAEQRALSGFGQTKYSVAPAYREMLMKSKQDPIADAMRQQAAAAEASNVGALKAGGARALIGGLGNVANQAAQQRANIEAQSFNRQQQALQTFGSQQQDVMNRNIADQRALLEHQYGRAQGQFDASRMAGMGIENARRQALSTALENGIPLAQQAFGIGEGNSPMTNFLSNLNLFGQD